MKKVFISISSSLLLILTFLLSQYAAASDTKIFVGGLSYNSTDSTLRQAFEKYGTVSSTKIIIDRDTGISRGFGFVEMPNSNEGNEAISELDGSMLDGRRIRVNEARPNSFSSRPERGGRPQ